MPDPKLAPRTASVSDLMDAASRAFRVTLGKCLPAALCATLFAALPNLYLLALGRKLDLLHPPQDPAFWVLSIAGFTAYQLAAAVVMLRQARLLSGAGADTGAELPTALNRWPALLLASLVGWFAVGAGLFALVLPGVFLAVCLALLRPVVLFEHPGAMAAIGRCMRLARPLWWKLLAAMVVALIIVFVCSVAALAALGLATGLLGAAGVSQPVLTAIGAACALAVDAIAFVYFNALWLVLYSSASASA
jgi:hypothetical protein